MIWQAWFTLAVLALVLGLLAFSNRPPDGIMLGGVTLLLLGGVLTPSEALAGLSNSGMVTVAVLYIVVAGLQETGGLGLLTQRFLGRPRSLRGAQARIVGPVALMSAFVNNTPLVAMMIAPVAEWARQQRLAASHLFIPLSYAAILGGVCTLVGTSTNLVVNGLVMRAAGDAAFSVLHLPKEGLGMFDITWVGLPCALVGALYLILFAEKLLPARRPAISPQTDPREYTLEMEVEPGSPLVGKTIEAAGLRHLPGTYLMEISRGEQVIAAVGPEEKLAANDRLVFVGIVDSVVDLRKIRGLKPATDQVFKLDAPRSARTLIEAVVSNTHPLLNRSVREGRFRSHYNAAIIAVARNGERLRMKIGDIVLQPGDTLLLEAHPSFVDQQRDSRDFFLVSRVEGSAPPRHEKAWVALAILGGMVALAAFEILPMLQAALLAAGLMILTHCVPASAARHHIEWHVLLVIAAALGIGQAIEKTGLANFFATALIGAAGTNPWLALAVLYGVTLLFTEFLTNNAAAVLVFPFALATALHLNASPMPFIICVMVAASCGFATPLGYQTHLMVYGPGGYRFGDFLRIGIPLDLLMWAVAVAIAPFVFPF
jgi:di/tricarboxylate transporter